MLICHEYDYTADADVGIDDVTEDANGDIGIYRFDYISMESVKTKQIK